MISFELLKSIFLWFALIGLIIFFFYFSIFIMGKEIMYKYQNRIITEKGNCLIDFKTLENNCLLITKSNCTNKAPYIYCGKYILEKNEF